MPSKDELARASGWLVLRSEEAYSRQLTHSCEVFIFKENGAWTVWRGNWVKGEPKPYSEKTLAAGLTFEQALERANEYVNWRKGRRGKAGATNQS